MGRLLSGVMKTVKILFFMVSSILLSVLSALAEEQPVNLGFLSDFSSTSRHYVHNMHQAAQMAVDEINQEGGLAGRRVVLITKDGGNNPETHYRLAISLVEEDGVAAIFGGSSSPCVIQASLACREKRIPYLVSIGNSQSIVVENGHDYVFLFEPNVWMETKGFSIFASLMPWRRYAWVGPDYLWGHEVLGYFKEHFQKMGVEIEWTSESWHVLGVTDFNPIIRRILDGKPDALVIASWGGDIQTLIVQATPSGLFNKMAVFGWFTYPVVSDKEVALPDGIWDLSRGPYNYLAQKFPLARRFVDAFKERYSDIPNGFTICAYDSFLAYKAAVQKAGSVEPEAVVQSLKGLEFTGLRGPGIIRAVDGQMNCPVYFGRIFYNSEQNNYNMDSIVEVPAEKTWLPEADVLSRRGTPRP